MSDENNSGSRLLPALAIGAVLLASAAPVWASAAGASSTFSGIGNANGLYFNSYGPNPTVDNGVRSFTHTRGYLNRGAYHFNGVGYYSFDAQTNQRLAYQVSDPYGNFIYYLNTPTYTPGASVAAGMWHNGGASWHFNWWASNYNVGVDTSNWAGDRNLEEISVGADGWGGCQNAYPANTAWSWYYRNRGNGWWYTVPWGTNFNWGNTPTWWVTGDIGNNGSISFGTSSCP